MSLPEDWTGVAIAVLGAMHAAMALVLLVNMAYLRRTRAPRPAQDDPHPSVSVLVPARNEEDNLRRLLPSLAAQTYTNVEVIVVDDASEDATWSVLETHVAAFEAAGHTLRPIRGTGPPAGWLGKPHALYQATRHATGEVFVFLDADTDLRNPEALRRLVARFASCEAASGPDAASMSGLPHYRDQGGAALLTSLVPFSILSALPLVLVPRTRTASIGALNGQVWAIHADTYRRLEPHATHRASILEDVEIGRTLKREGLRLHFVDLSDCVAVRMYGTLGEAWRGFRKNAYLLAGGRPATFIPLWLLYTALFVVGPWLALAAGVPWLLASVFLLKGGSDVSRGLPGRLLPLAPLIFVLAIALQLDSAVSHWTGRVAWKGRTV